MNLFVTIDLTNAAPQAGPAARHALGQDEAPLVPAPGDPGYDAYLHQRSRSVSARHHRSAPITEHRRLRRAEPEGGG